MLLTLIPYRFRSETRLTDARPPSTPIHIIDDDSLLDIFSLPTGDFGQKRGRH